jgi:hypothetical protein
MNDYECGRAEHFLCWEAEQYWLWAVSVAAEMGDGSVTVG